MCVNELRQSLDGQLHLSMLPIPRKAAECFTSYFTSIASLVFVSPGSIYRFRVCVLCGWPALEAGRFAPLPLSTPLIVFAAR